MTSFRYRMQRVLDARDAIVSRCEALLAESERDLERCRGEQANCDAAVQRMAARDETRPKHDALPAHECLAQRVWFHHLTDRLSQAMRLVVTQHAQVGKRRASLQQALVDRKVMESLSNRERLAWLENVRKIEQKTMDEQAASAYLRRREDLRDTGARRILTAEDEG